MMNSQTPQGDFYPGYGATMSNSPSGNRSGYATVGLSQAIGAGRRNHHGTDGSGASANAALYGDDRFTPFDAPQRYDRGTPVQNSLHSPFNAFPVANQPSWGYGPGSAATMSGPINDGSRIRQANRRPPLHTEWTNEPQLGNHNNMSYYQPPQHLGVSSLGLPNTGSPDPFNVQPPSVNIQNYGTPEIRTYPETKKDMGDLIPTALVIKNIPFNVRKEYLTTLMVEMHLPQPYAFNYHFDQGVFRGLAFANFQNAQDTASVINQMNGLEIQGRKLRVEYKKMLPEHERERIEREKREKRGQLEEQHRGPAHQISMSSLATATSVQRSGMNDRMNGMNGMNGGFDLNDPITLRYYLELYMFHNDDSREVHIFPADILPEERRLIHVLAHNMGLEHTSLGDGDNRQVHVSKSKFATGARQPTVQQPGVTLDGHPRGLSRAATYDFSDRQQSSIHSVNRSNLAIPNSPENHLNGGVAGLRGVKSFADLRSFSPSPSPSLGSGAMGPPTSGHNSTGIQFMSHYAGEGPFGPSLTTPTTPGSAINPPSASADPSSLVNSLGSLGLGSSSFDGNGAGIPTRSRDTPGAIGSQRPSANGNGIRANPERQPRGPGTDWENPSGFTRGRANGHMQRGSDSSDNTGRVGSSSLY